MKEINANKALVGFKCIGSSHIGFLLVCRRSDTIFAAILM